MKYRLLDLFSGIGGFSLGLERSGNFQTVAFCEIEPFPRKVLAKHWPGVPIYDDVRTLTADRLAADGIAVDAICGGFPCQDISYAGKGAGLAGERSGLWREIARLAGELRPEIIILENVAALLGRGLGDVLGDLAALGFDAEWHCISASAIGAPHRRDRIWIVAYAAGGRSRRGGGGPETVALHDGSSMANANSQRQLQSEGFKQNKRRRIGVSGSRISNPNGTGLEIRQSVTRHHVEKCAATVGNDWWSIEPNVGRVAHGIPQRVDRLKALGNAVVPQIPELIARAIGPKVAA